MKPNGVIYNAAIEELNTRAKKEALVLRRGLECWAGVRVPILRSERRRSFLQGIANGLLLLALFGLIFTFGPVLKSELKYRFSRLGKKAVQRVHFADLIAMEINTQSLVIPGGDFAIIIPKIEASAKILPNIDAGNRAEYSKALLEGVAHAKGTVLPGMKGNIYLFAHSAQSPWQIARYNAVFYLLRELEESDEVIVYFYGGQHRYQVFKKETLPPSDVRYFQPQNEEEILVLQTCWPPGTTLKQLVVLAKKA